MYVPEPFLVLIGIFILEEKNRVLQAVTCCFLSVSLKFVLLLTHELVKNTSLAWLIKNRAALKWILNLDAEAERAQPVRQRCLQIIATLQQERRLFSSSCFFFSNSTSTSETNQPAAMQFKFLFVFLNRPTCLIWINRFLANFSIRKYTDPVTRLPLSIYIQILIINDKITKNVRGIN